MENITGQPDSGEGSVADKGEGSGLDIRMGEKTDGDKIAFTHIHKNSTPHDYLGRPNPKAGKGRTEDIILIIDY